jgi:predicted peroxiredoxin
VKTRLAILLWAATPERPELCATPFVHATAAAALDCEVEVHFTGRAARLLVAGVADQVLPTPGESKSAYRYMKEAANLGVRFIGCCMALHSQTQPGELYIPEYQGTATATDFVLRALDPEWRTLVF